MMSELMEVTYRCKGGSLHTFTKSFADGPDLKIVFDGKVIGSFDLVHLDFFTIKALKEQDNG
jgi:hypothetical protein